MLKTLPQSQVYFEGWSDDTSDVPTCDNNRVNVESELVESLINRDTSIDNSSKIDLIFEEFAGELAHIAPIFTGNYVILRERLLKISRLISNIESLKDNPILVTDSDSSDTSLSYLDNYLPEFETFSDHTEETRSGSTTTNSCPNYSLPRDYPDFEDSRAHGFVHLFELHILSFI
ncbi:hypothetical protein Tco_0440039 [Tanacetum coccineum]